MSELNWQDIKALSTDESFNEVIRSGEEITPELNMIPSRTYPSDAFTYWRRDKRIVAPIYVTQGEGVSSSKAAWVKERRQMIDFERPIEVDQRAVSERNTPGARTAHDVPFDIEDETVSEEMSNLRQQMTAGLYTPQVGGPAPNTLDDFTTFAVDALDGNWNGEGDLIADLVAGPTVPELALLGPAGNELTTAYLVFAAPQGLHWGWGLGRQFQTTEKQTFRRKDEAKSLITGQEETLLIEEFRVRGTHSALAKSEFDVVAVKNIPRKRILTGLTTNTFFLDSLVGNITSDLYLNASVRPNLFLVDARVLTTWANSRRSQGYNTGGSAYADIDRAPASVKFSKFEDTGVLAMGSSKIPPTPWSSALTIQPEDSPTGN